MLTEGLAKEIRVSTHFTLWEFLYSEKAVKFYLMPLQLVIGFLQFSLLQKLCLNCLEPLREYMNAPIKITSGYRCYELNEKIKGSETSDHKRAMAADIVCDDLEKAFHFLRTLKFTQLILENDGKNRWIHISYDEDNLKCQVLIYVNGKYSNYES